jgi:hypothetical protein
MFNYELLSLNCQIQSLSLKYEFPVLFGQALRDRLRRSARSSL